MDKVKLGFVGCGFMGQLIHMPNFLSSEQCEVVALADLRFELAKKVAAHYHIPKVYGSDLEMAKDQEVTAVAAISSEARNPELAMHLLAAGKHVYLEKPMAGTAALGREMAEAARKAGKHLMIAYMKRCDTGVLKAKEIVDEYRSTGELGRVTYARGHCFGGDWVYGPQGKLIQTEEKYPGLAAPRPEWVPEGWGQFYHGFNNVYCHNINLMRHFLGEPDGVASSLLNRGSSHVVFDYGSFLATLEAGHMSAHRWDEHFVIYYENGSVTINFPPPLSRNEPARVLVYRGGKMRELSEHFAVPDWAFRREAEHFLECVRENREPVSSGADSVRDLELVEEIFRRGLKKC